MTLPHEIIFSTEIGFASLFHSLFIVSFSYWYIWGPCSMTGEMPDTVQINGNELKVLKVDDAVNTTFVCEVKNRIGIGKDQVTAFVRGEWCAPKHTL